MNAVRYHPREELLIDYAGGGASAGEAMLIAAHLVGCPECRDIVGMCEKVGGALLQGLDPASLPSDLLDRTLDKLQRLAPDNRTAPRRAATALPGFLVDRIGVDLADIPWQPTENREVYRIPECPENEQLWLVRAAAGQHGLPHFHVGDEWTVVLEGGFFDDRGSYAKGDFRIMRAGSEHCAIADLDGPCITLLMLRGPLRFTGSVGPALTGLFG